MEAAHLVKVPDSITRGVNAIPAATPCEFGKSGSLASCVDKSNVGAGPAPTAAINSGTTLPSSLLGASHSVSNGQGRQYKGSDDAQLNPKGNGSEGVHASNA